MSTENRLETGRPPWAEEEKIPMYTTQQPPVAPRKPAAEPARNRRSQSKKNARPPESGNWEVQVRTGGSGKAKWGWLQSVQGMAPEKSQIRDQYGAGHYRIVESAGYSAEFTIARVPAGGGPPIDEAEPERRSAGIDEIEERVAHAVKIAVGQAMSSTITQLRPFLEGLRHPPESPAQTEALQALRSDLGDLAGLVRSLAEAAATRRPDAAPSTPGWQQTVIERVMAAGLANMGIEEDDDDEGPDATDRLIEIGSTLLSGVLQSRGAEPQQAVQPQPGHPSQPMPAPRPPPPIPSLAGMTPEIEAELRAYAHKIGYDYRAAMVEAAEKGATAEALLEQCRALIGPLEESG